MQLDEIKDKTRDIADLVTDYAETFYKLTILKITQKSTQIASAGIVVLALLVFGLFVTLFGSIALAWWLGDLVQSRALGFLLVAVFFLVCMLIMIAMRKKIVFPYFRNHLIRKFYE